MGGSTAKNKSDFHLLLPATNKDVNLCKTLLTAAVLDYPTPTLIAWNQTFDNTGKNSLGSRQDAPWLTVTGGLLGGGSHVGKITGVLQYLESLDSSADSDLVLMMDSYGLLLFPLLDEIKAHTVADIWFQLRPEVLLSRYHAINEAANVRLRQRLGSAVDAEDLQQTIIFGAGKRCAPNQVCTLNATISEP